MKKIILLIFLTLFLLFIVVIINVNAKSQNNPKKDATKAQQSADSNQRGSNQLPLVVKIIPPEKNKIEAESEAKEKEEKAVNEKRLILFTGLLAAIGLLQLIVFAWQARRLRQSVKVTKEAADAAKKSADALPLIERAYIFVEVEEIKKKNRTIDETCNDVATSLITKHTTILVDVCITNHGRTPAIIKDSNMRIEYRVGSPEGGKETIYFPKIPPSTVIASRKSIHPTTNAKIEILNAEWAAIEIGDTLLYCLGEIEYQDILKMNRRTCFSWIWNHRLKRFEISTITGSNGYE